MLSKNELKYIQSLCQKKQRQAEGLFLAEGTKLVEELLHSRYPVRKMYATAEWIEQHPAAGAVLVTDQELAKISTLQTPHQVLALAEQRLPKEEPLRKNTFTLVLDGIQDPGNLGTILRIADWFGIGQVIASEDTVELYNPKVIQSSMGSFLRVNTWYRSLPEVFSAEKIPVYGALLKGNSLYDTEPVREGMLVIGNESKGIRSGILPFISHPVTIPRIGGAESLNAAVATGILVSHLIRK